MNRRVFTKLLTLGTSSLGSLQNNAEGKEGSEATPMDEPKTDAAPGPRERAEGPTHEPVKVEDFKELARAKLPKATFEYITTGSADEITLRENVAAFQRLKVLPPLLTGVSKVDLTTVVLKQRIA